MRKSASFFYYMADNFLEKKFEEYQKKKAEYERLKKLGLVKKQVKNNGSEKDIKRRNELASPRHPFK